MAKVTHCLNILGDEKLHFKFAENDIVILNNDVAHLCDDIFKIKLDKKINVTIEGNNCYCSESGITMAEDDYSFLNLNDFIVFLHYLMHEVVHWITIYVMRLSINKPTSIYELLAFNFGERNLYEVNNSILLKKMAFQVYIENEAKIEDIEELFMDKQFNQIYRNDFDKLLLCYLLFDFFLYTIEIKLLLDMFKVFDKCKNQNPIVSLKNKIFDNEVEYRSAFRTYLMDCF